MKKTTILLGLLFCAVTLLGQDKMPLDSIINRYIDLTHYKGRVIELSGTYEGDRLVFSNASNVVLQFDGEIQSTHEEDAICFNGPAHKVIIRGKLKINGAITFWNVADSVEITGVESRYAHTGIRATGDFPHGRVNIHHNRFIDIGYEGVYIGPSYKGQKVSSNVRIHHNTFIRTGWDAVQLGNCMSCYIEYNRIIRPATKKERWQDWGITVNPGSLVFLRKNRYLRIRQRLQCLDSRCFNF